MHTIKQTAMASELHQRTKSVPDVPAVSIPSPAAKTPPAPTASTDAKKHTNPIPIHPSGRVKHGRAVQFLRGLSFLIYFLTCSITIQLTQWIGSPLYFVNRAWYDAYMAVAKEYFGLVITTMTYIWGPTTIRISGDESMAGQIKKTADGRVEFDFPDHLVLMANHQIYTDWLYLWWVSYANNPSMHGHIYIILKESLKYVPILGPGMMFFGFIFMSRKMAVDQPRMAYRLQKLRQQHTDGKGNKYYNPMWLLLFPEGTNTTANGRVKSVRWAEKLGVKDPQHLLLPRSTGMYFCLTQLKGFVDYVYDCTVTYEGVPRGGYGEDYFSLSGTYFEGLSPKSVNFHWRRMRVADIPLDDHDQFDKWLRERWYEKDAMIDTYLDTGRLPASSLATGSDQGEYIETEVRTHHPWEILSIFSVLGTLWFVYRFASMVWQRLYSVA